MRIRNALFLAGAALTFTAALYAGSIEAALARLSRAEADLRNAPSKWTAERLEQAARDADEVVARGTPALQREARNLLGVMYIRLERYRDAIAILSAIESPAGSPQTALYRYNLGRAHERNEEPAAAFRLFRESLSSGPDPQIADLAGAGISRLLDSLETNGKIGARDAAEACVALLEAGRAQAADECFRERLRKWAGAPGSGEMRLYVLRRRPDPEGFALPSEWQPAELRLAFSGDYQAAFDEESVRKLFPSWTGQPWEPEFVKYLVARGDVFYPAALGTQDAEMWARRAVASYAAAWALDPSNTVAVARAAGLLASFRKSAFTPPSGEPQPGRGRLIGALADSVAARSPSEGDASHWQSWAGVYEAVGDAVATVRPCDASRGEGSGSPLYYWLRALDSQFRARGEDAITVLPAPSIPDGVTLPSAPSLNRRLANCYRDSNSVLFRRFNGETAAADVVRYKWLFHTRSIWYPGGVLKSAAQAGLLQILDSPPEWGQGTRGYARRLASSEGARAVRHLMAFALDAAFAQEPRYVRAPYRDKTSRFFHAAMQTFVCRNERLQWRPSIWRIGSAFGSELASNAWRPPGGGIGSRGIGPALTRGAFVLAGDTGSNLVREFLPRRGKVGRFLRLFL